MAEYPFAQGDIRLAVDTTYYNTLDLESFSLMLKNPSYCYKFYWLEAIVQLISQGVSETTFNDLIDEMIANAWYSVLEFHIHLSGFVEGTVRDNLELAVLRLAEQSGLSPHASKTEIKNAIKEHEAALRVNKDKLTDMVPYRALAGFFDRHATERADWQRRNRMVAYIEAVNKIAPLPYTMGGSSRLKREVYFNRDWMQMIQDHTVAILGWIQYEKVRWLQNMNPEVPGLVYKLAPMEERVRKLSAARKLWTGILELEKMDDVFTQKPIDVDRFALDHFIPWSFVMNDELWNLMPMDSSLNSSKNNKLPKWDPFFDGFSRNQYVMYTMIHDERLPKIHKLYEKCFRDNLYSIWANQELYRKGNTKEQFCNILEKNMRPVYDSARRQGYPIWM